MILKTRPKQTQRKIETSVLLSVKADLNYTFGEWGWLP